MFRNRLIESESLRKMLDVSLDTLIRHVDPSPSARVRCGSILVYCAPSVLPFKKKRFFRRVPALDPSDEQSVAISTRTHVKSDNLYSA